MNQFSQGPEYTIKAISNFYKNFVEIFGSKKLITGVNDTGAG
jgi:hypothetical protein